MILFRRTAAFVAIGLLAGCANPVPSSFTPGAGFNQTQPSVKVNPGKTYTGRVLYIADIDGQPGVGQILVYTAGMKNPQFLREITNGTGRPFGLWVDSQNILYVANEPNKYPASVTEFKPGAPRVACSALAVSSGQARRPLPAFALISGSRVL